MRRTGGLDAQKHGFYKHCGIVLTGKFWFKLSMESKAKLVQEQHCASSLLQLENRSKLLGLDLCPELAVLVLYPWTVLHSRQWRLSVTVATLRVLG